MDQMTNIELFQILKDCQKNSFDKELNFEQVQGQICPTLKQQASDWCKKYVCPVQKIIRVKIDPWLVVAEQWRSILFFVYLFQLIMQQHGLYFIWIQNWLFSGANTIPSRESQNWGLWCMQWCLIQETIITEDINNFHPLHNLLWCFSWIFKICNTNCGTTFTVGNKT